MDHPHPPPLIPSVVGDEDVDDDRGEEGGEAVQERVDAHYEVVVLSGKMQIYEEFVLRE